MSVMMSFRKDTSYQSIAFSSESPKDKFYSYIDATDLAAICEDNMGDITKCRSIGILSSDEGKYYLSPLDHPDCRKEGSVRLTMIYLETSPQPTVVPYPVQIFGDLQWKNRPVLFVRILQVMTAAMAIRLNKINKEVTSLHCASGPMTGSQENESLT